MDMKGKKIGIAMTGSFCTFEKSFVALEKLAESGAILYPILSGATQSISCRFGNPTQYLERLKQITDQAPIVSIEEAEPIGPGAFLDMCVILPCTGNTAAKLACGITDTPVLMAAKAHLRTNKPLVIFISTNDGLGMNMKNIGLLCNTKNIFFVPFGQDNWEKKPNSLVAHIDLLIPTIEQAFMYRQYQPMLLSY